MGLSVWRETSKKLTVYRVCYTPIETLREHLARIFFQPTVHEFLFGTMVLCKNFFLMHMHLQDFFSKTPNPNPAPAPLPPSPPFPQKLNGRPLNKRF